MKKLETIFPKKYEISSDDYKIKLFLRKRFSPNPRNLNLVFNLFLKNEQERKIKIGKNNSLGVFICHKKDEKPDSIEKEWSGRGTAHVLCSLIIERNHEISSVLKIESEIPFTIKNYIKLLLDERKILDNYIPFIQSLKIAKTLMEWKWIRKLKIKCETPIGYGYLIPKHLPNIYYFSFYRFYQNVKIDCKNENFIRIAQIFREKLQEKNIFADTLCFSDVGTLRF